jgi:pyridoxal phosphate-dependent aminotransferase EpsN
MNAPLPIVVYGTGGHGRETALLVRSMIQAGTPWQLSGYLDDDTTQHHRLIGDLPVLGTSSILAAQPGLFAVALGIGSPNARRQLSRALLVVQLPVLIHPSVPAVERVCGDGSQVHAGTVLTTDIHVGNFAISTGTWMSVTIARSTTGLAPGVTLHRRRPVGEGADGAAPLIPCVHRCLSVIGAGAVVTRDVPMGVTAACLRTGRRSFSRPARIYLSPPHLGETDLAMVAEAFRTNWIAPLGPHVDAFEREFSAYVDTPHAVALSSGTAALHLALLALGIGDGDTVWVSTLTFAASAFPIRYVGATPVFVDSDHATGIWTRRCWRRRSMKRPCARRCRAPWWSCTAVSPVRRHGSDHGGLRAAWRGPDRGCGRGAGFALQGAGGRQSGQARHPLVQRQQDHHHLGRRHAGHAAAPTARVRSLATQAREPVPHYEHTRIGYNYRLSNVLAGIGRGQLQVLESRVAARRAVFDRYASDLADIPGIMLMPEATFGSPDSRANRWLTVLTVDPHHARLDAERLRLALEAEEIESRPVWKPMHQQPVFRRSDCIGGSVADALFATGLCLPSGSSLMRHEQDRVIGVIRRECEAARARGKRYSSAAA